LNLLEGITRVDDRPKKPALFLLFFSLLALGLRLLLFRYHHIIEGDGIHYAALARLISRDGSLLGAANEYWSNLWPLIIAAFDVFVREIELAGRLASAVFGALTVFPVYLFSREFLNTRTSLVASSLVIAQPYLLRFSTLLYSESFFTFLLAWTIWLGIRLIKSPERLERWLWLALLVGVGLWTRPEVQTPAFLMAIIALGRCVLKRKNIQRSLTGALVLAGIVVLFLFSRALLIRHYLGQWHFGFGEKLTINLKMGLLYYGDSEQYLNRFENGRFVNLWPKRVNALRFIAENRALILKRMKSNLPRLFTSYLTVLSPTRGVPLLRLIGVGLTVLGILSLLLTKKTRGWSLLLLLSLVFYSLPLLMMFIHDRLVVPLAIVTLVFTAAGLLILETAVAGVFRRRYLSPLPILSFLFVAAFVMRSASWARHDRSFIWESDPVVQKEAGLYLKGHFPQEAKILTWGAHIPYYFYDGNLYDSCLQNIPFAPYEEVLDYARRERVDLLVLPEWLLLYSDFPIKWLTEEGVRPEGLELVKVIGRAKPERVWIYRVL